jgi:hypothetical protein
MAVLSFMAKIAVGAAAWRISASAAESIPTIQAGSTSGPSTIASQ